MGDQPQIRWALSPRSAVVVHAGCLILQLEKPVSPMVYFYRGLYSRPVVEEFKDIVCRTVERVARLVDAFLLHQNKSETVE